jgi:2-dehydropantoate 2-reductase
MATNGTESSTPKLRILVFGTGGVGCIYAYFLHQSGADVTTVCRSNFAAVRDHGIKIASKLFGNVSFQPQTVVRSVRDATAAAAAGSGPFDFVVVCSKAFPGTAALIQDAVTPGRTAVVLCQNGIGIEAEYAALFPGNTILSGVVYLPTTQTAPGEVMMGPLQKLQIGTYPSSQSSSSQSSSSASPTAAAAEAAKVFATAFRSGGGIIEVHADVQAARWLKLAVNVAWNPICALTRCDDANFFRSSPVAEGTIRAVMAEIAALAARDGYPDVVTQAAVDEQLTRPRERLETGGKEPSMLTDVREGRPLEVDAILGNAMALAKKYGIETPRLDMLYALAKALSFSIAPDETWRPIAN